MGREKQMRAVSMQWALRLGVLLGAILGAVCASQAPVAAQTTAGTVKFFTDGALSKAWTRLDNSTTPATPLVEWGDTVWIKLEGVAFNNDNGAPPVTLKFRLVVPGTTNPPADYGFEIDGDQIVHKGSDYRVAFDAGFYRNGAGANVVWRMGVPQLAKVWPNGNADPNSADKKNAQLRPLAGMPNPPAVDKLVLTPGEWEVWATQNTMADTTHYKFRVMNPLTIRRYNPYTQVFDTTPWTDAVTSGQEFSDPAANDINGSPTFGTNRLLEAYAPPTPPVGFNPIWTLGQVDHGHTSAPYLFGVADRSRLDQVLAADQFPAAEAGNVCLACRAGFGDMNPTGGPDVTNPPNPAQPKDAYTTNPEDYP
ncbi:MAG TPA: hypothetical protein VHR86_07760, partial [Armatimonadota bacterium]|nr:hypothetical protein [Armatimonadota bacterium]